MTPAKNKKEAMEQLIDLFGDVLANNGCNDFSVENNPETFLMLEEAGADNLGLSLEDFRNCTEYDDYKPSVSEDGTTIFTQDFTILAVIRKELGL